MKKTFPTIIRHALVTALACVAASCGSDSPGDEPWLPDEPTPEPPPAVAPDFDSEIKPFDEDTRATDTYTPGDNNDIYWQANTFADTVRVVYDGESASATSTSSSITANISGAYVAISIPSGNKAVVRVSGASDNGALKIYSNVKTLLILDGVSLASRRGPAVNSQSKRRLFVNMAQGSVNTLSDAAQYQPDHYYASGASESTEDRKGAFFAEDHVIISGMGLLKIKGNYTHALATDGSLRILPGSTLAVESSRRNGIHAKGSAKEQAGITIDGGYVYTLCTGDAAKCLKSDNNITINGGILDLNNSSAAIFDTSDNDTSSGAGIKSDAGVTVAGGIITVKTTGNGAKGITVGKDLTVEGGEITITSKGCRYVYNDAVHSSPSGLKADNNITILDGTVNVGMFGDDANSDAIDAGNELRIGGGQTYCYAFGNGLYAKNHVYMAGGYVYSLSEKVEAVQSDKAIEISGGYTIAHSPRATASQSGAASRAVTKVKNAVVIAAGGNVLTSPDMSQSANVAVIPSVTVKANQPFSVTTADGSKSLFAMRFLPACDDVPLLVASPEFKAATEWSLNIGGTIPAGASGWNGYYDKTVLGNPEQSVRFTIR